MRQGTYDVRQGREKGKEAWVTGGTEEKFLRIDFGLCIFTKIHIFVNCS